MNIKESVGFELIIDDKKLILHKIKIIIKLLQDFNIEIKNSLGQNIFSNIFSNHIGSLTDRVSLASLPKGLYFVTVTTSEGSLITERIAYTK